jgi:hypothetical protein
MQVDFIFIVCFIISVACGQIIVAYIKDSPNAVREPAFALMLQPINPLYAKLNPICHLLANIRSSPYTPR